MKVLLIAVALVILTVSSAFAQVPATVRAQWTPNPVTDNVTQYVVTLDAAPPITTPLLSCNAVCIQPIVVPTFGLHTVTVVAQNLAFDGTLQSSAPASITFTLAAAPVVVAGLRVTK